MKTPVQGLHHLTVIAGDPQRNIDFYVKLLGQRLVKVTVNFDDPGTYHLYYGDEVGSPGTIMTFFPWPHAKKGERGNGEVTALAYAAPLHARGGWLARLSEMNLDFREGTRFGSPVLSFEDPDGLTIEIVFEDGADVPQPWRNDFVPPALNPRGFHSVTIWAGRGDTLERLLVTNLGFTRVGSEQDAEGERVRYKGDSDGVGLYVDVVVREGGRRGTFGAGSVHHVALRTRDDAEQEEYRKALTLAGYGVTPVQDRQYFHSIYFRDTSGVLFEIATDAPGFAYDEEVAELGSHLKLPDWYEPRRAAIEAHVVPIRNPEYGVTIGGRDAPARHTPSGDERPKVDGPHQGQPLRTAGRDAGQTRVGAVLVHGRGSSAQDILGLADAFSMSVFAYVAPQARGGTWYPQSFLAPLERNQPDLDSALQAVADAVAHLEAQGIAPEHILIGGFSQGACLASEFVARNARRYGGLFAFSGGLIGPEGTPRDYAGNLAGTPVFLGCSDVDPHIPVERVRETARVLEGLGAKVDARIYPGMAHTVVQDEIEAVQKIMQDLSVTSLGV